MDSSLNQRPKRELVFTSQWISQCRKFRKGIAKLVLPGPIAHIFPEDFLAGIFDPIVCV